MSSEVTRSRIGATGAPGEAVSVPAPSRSARHDERSIDLGELEKLQILNEQGVARADMVPKLPVEELMRVYRAMVLTRKLDVRMLAMQRQGEMGTFAPGLGQEATQIGQVYPLRDEDWYSPSYRSFGAQAWRGWQLDQLLLLWAGFFRGFEVPEGVNDLPFSIVIGSHVVPAVGVAMGMRCRGEPGVMMVNFGDGALSQGPVAEAMNFAAVYKAPVVFVCENNQYAISVPVERQHAVRELARRAPGFGMPAIRVDGNDILAMIVACTRAVEHARRGDGPFFIEAVTYRMSLHTTADDPKVYRSDEEVRKWEPKCPLRRFERWLTRAGLLDEAAVERIGSECEKQVLDARESFRRKAVADPREVFDFVYEDLPPELAEQKREYLEKLKRKGVD
ncbi:MAG: pyruvate dehydrogenase (acetyl-transferring) E1 component subunit alpha [Planctomycetota bacterium]|jgi:pyruvate dehydrogenase E1 component alpha subunit